MQFETELILDMIGALFMVPFLYLLNQLIFKRLQKKHSFFNKKLMNRLFCYHMFFGILYYAYAFLNPSDSHKYFLWPQNDSKSWVDFFGTETTFVNFISYPFINGLGFSYEMMMILYAWFGFVGFVYAYLFFKESIALEVKVFKHVDLLTLILFLPNMHFWTASMGKGAIIFLGLMLFAYSIKEPKKRIAGLLLGSFLIFYIRPHVFLLLTIGGLGGFLMGKDSVSWKKKGLICLTLIAGLFLIQDKILAVVHLNNSTDLLGDFIKFASKRSNDLNNAGSGVNMAGYSLPEKFFTFWFRPLFFDSPSILGIIVSAENLVYLLLFLKIVKIDFLKFLKNAPVNVRISLVLFLITSFAMTFVMSNLGIIIRQKSMVMYFLFFVIYYYLAHEKTLSINLNLKLSNTVNLAKAA
tara:strand:+ start:57333 stop:58562 length:1230 start_codon:yes stop_codon:yes gene_type:complete